MSKPIKISRLFSASDAQMLEFARVVHGYNVTDLADFTAFDPDFDATWAASLLTAISNAENFSSDNQLIDVLAQLTLDVEAKMKECRQFFQGMKFFIEKAFPKKPGTWDEFGYNDYGRSRSNQARMIQFMLDLHESATKYATQLDNANFGATRIAEIATLAQELQTLNTQQESAKGGRSTASNDRVIMLNHAWAMTQTVRKAAKVIYMNNWGKWQLYNIPWGGEGQPPQQPEEIVGTVPYGVTLGVLIPSMQPNSVLTITNIGQTVMQFCGSDIAGNPCPGGIVLAAGDSVAVNIQDITQPGITPTLINVMNTFHPTPVDGEFSIVLVS
jgi:hypothetical protein